ncbi:hypothetical protein SESBI_39187 [Sesbania bispinosa]|nr:hypothetical protein SESBI_39187 [Sesbania bispinosa]
MENTLPAPNDGDELPEIIVELDSDEIHSFQLAKRSLVGKVMSNKTLNKGAIRSIVMKAWGDPVDLQITDMGVNTFLFSFFHKEEVIEVLNKGPWYVMGNLISLQCWVPQATAYEIDFQHVYFWIQIHGLPLDMMNTNNAAKIMSKVGEVMKVENPSVEAMAPFNPLLPKYSSKLGVPPARPLLTLMQEKGFWRAKQQPPMEDTQGSRGKERENLAKEAGDNSTGVPEDVTEKGDPQNQQQSISGGHGVQHLGMRSQSYDRVKTKGMGPSSQPDMGPTQKERDTDKGASATTIDLQAQQRRPGLGPEHLEDLAITPEFIGLPTPQVLLDYTSPENGRYEGVTLSLEEIQKETDEGDNETMRTSKRIKSIMGEWKNDTERNNANQGLLNNTSDYQMAEEAGLSMPPPQP